ncbi:hypothetical protein DICPUDRAFT_152219 [Dictyostelium purpureum]|uniref:Expressed protein n=1 Tax=Dictyostelium purpureum TaxID=5786 RepID=F0ZKR7_DICPU|nr:uncharacterized protein DICPUDRAFT_72405 [Dictyostelium purpureum]XP_003288001.1 uncharacterized protein DICPUDRAFT_152215 [Dictyostelium purpureum]XP_003288002.1 uncharacterized protein DICPUDRAFT_152216 [Dictyostelium purpureum]XP_003288003.1 uncharacterized protein DICPUDRAFT_152217 [Dictyostelium purpureum]XP_003288004.1 uncharacterized protein DICPUDRAFT_92026 [Dictyostelium purpureum]XP_003288005.1 uncharacterized protein DICPUDRAFT_152219 [Dictyostelium purpureum]EGC35457.1 hypothet|eukprot:XP_003288000.1 hypothetical protein DICPUDRAFT_72405 [Dictyostelium purpureum]
MLIDALTNLSGFNKSSGKGSSSTTTRKADTLYLATSSTNKTTEDPTNYPPPRFPL